MIDPLAEIVSLLQPAARYTKVIGAAGRWGVRRTDVGHPFYYAVLEVSCRLAVADAEPITLEQGDFALIPAAFDFTISSMDGATAEDFAIAPTLVAPGEFRLGKQDGPPALRAVVGHCVFASPDATMLVSLLPQLVHVRGERRLATLVELVGEESRAQRPARDVILARLLEVLLIEALRSTAGTAASPGLLRGLADARLAAAIRRMHESPARSWTVVELAKEAALSRSAFFERFSRAVGVAPMEYLLAWRMALAKNLLMRDAVRIADVAQRVGYSSASTFSVAFSRHVGVPPTQYTRAQLAALASEEIA